RGGPDDDPCGAGLDQVDDVVLAAHAAPDPAGGQAAELAHQIAVVALAEGGVEVDDRHLAVEGEAPRQVARVLRRLEDPLGPTPQLHRPAPHQVDARDDHGRTTTPAARRISLAWRMVTLPSWKIEAARAASASPTVSTRAMSCGVPAPPEAITGRRTARATAPVSARP